MGCGGSSANRVDPYESLGTGLEAHTATRQTATPLNISVAVSKATGRFKKLLMPATGNNGPDELAQAELEVTWEVDAAVRLRMTSHGPASSTPVSVPTLMKKTCDKYPNHVAMGVKRGGEWQKWTFSQYYRDVSLVAKAFIKLGLEPYHGVGILGFNAPEWFISNMAAIFAGGVSVGIYTTNSPEAVHYVSHSSSCNILVVENDLQAQKVIRVKDALPELRAIIQYSEGVQDPNSGVLTWAQVLQLGKEVEESLLADRLMLQAPNKCCALIYTSGTTGHPKAVMLSHDNITWSQRQMAKEMQIESGKEVVVSYLPLSHVAAQALDLYGVMLMAGAVYFAQPDALRGSLIHTLREVKPTLFMGVPRVYEKFQEAMGKAGRNSKAFKKAVIQWATKIGRKGTLRAMQGEARTPVGWTLSKLLVFNKVKKELGFSRCKLYVSGAAPLATDTVNFFMGFNIPVTEMYGMSECSGAHTAAFPWRHLVGTVGCTCIGRESKFHRPDQDGIGELYMRGRHVFMGYLGQEEETCQTLDQSGWLHTGDLGKEDNQGFICLTGRSKELIVTAGGENVAPVPIENRVKRELPVISNCMLVGDRCKFLSMLITLKTVLDEETLLPSDQLSAETVDWCENLGSDITSLSELLKQRNKSLEDAIQTAIDRANTEAISRAQRIQKWVILPKDFSIPGGELGPTLKLKRPVVLETYSDIIMKLYTDS